MAARLSRIQDDVLVPEPEPDEGRVPHDSLAERASLAHEDLNIMCVMQV